MKALSIKNPFAALIVAGIKNIENRTWVTQYKGDIAIVSTKMSVQPFYWKQVRAKVKSLGLPFPEKLCEYDGYILGVATMTGCVWFDGDNICSDHQNLDRVNLDWWTGNVGFILENPRKLTKPIPVKGQLGLWNLPADIEILVKHDICHL